MMSSYLNESDSDEDTPGAARVELGEEQKAEVMEMTASLKSEGNAHFSSGEYEQALERYTAAVNCLKEAGLKDCLILLNRSATYLAMQRYVPALNDANQGMPLLSPLYSTLSALFTRCTRSSFSQGRT
jgi:tetratricopeptide (TPR) repeat protein